jgi:hypothetical protein
MFKKFGALKRHHKIFYSLVIVVALVCIWRGIWRLLDLFLLPENYILSSLVTLGAGIVIIAAAHYKLA